jgi:hypothetical protein
MPDVSFSSTIERRRSQRISESVPLVVRGIDLLGNPFEERTSTQNLNLQGCRYFSTHHLPRNSWISLEVGDGVERRNVRARVAWIHRPHSIRELFHVAIELEGPENIWGLPSHPEGWTGISQAEDIFEASSSPAAEVAFSSLHTTTEGLPTPMNGYPAEPVNNFEAPFVPAVAPDSHDSSDNNTWRARLASEMAIAQRQWDEILQSSIDRTLQRLAEQLPERAQDAVRATEEKMAEQYADLGQMLAHVTSEAQAAAANVKASIDQEVWRARDVLENTRQQMIERLGADAEARVAPHAARVPELLRELASREELIAESLQLHRERLRQASENALREVTAQAEATAATLRNNFEAVRTQALAKWTEELEGLSARAGHSAGEAISRTSEWFQQETRERLQVLAEQTLANATASFQDETTKAAAQFATHLEGQSVFHLAQVHQQLDNVANDLTGRTRSQLAEAAETAAASFGHVLHSMSNDHAQQFAANAQDTVEQKRQELDDHARNSHASFENDSAITLQNLRQQTTWHMETAVGEARSVLATESATALEAHRNEHSTRTQQYSEELNRIAAEAEGQSGTRIQTAADSWTVASVRRLNEHGQNVIESLMRSADHALRDSASRIFENLAAALRVEGTNFAAAAAVSASADVPSENYAPVNDNFAPTSHGGEQQVAEQTTYQQDGGYQPDVPNQFPPNDNPPWQPGL